MAARIQFTRCSDLLPFCSRDEIACNDETYCDRDLGHIGLDRRKIQP